MTEPFHPLQAQQVAEAFNAEGVEYLFIGKSGAILLGYPGSTQDVDIFAEKSDENIQRIVRALLAIGFRLEEKAKSEVLRGQAFVQLTDGPFDLDLVFAPDGIASYAEAKSRSVTEGIFPVANLRDIIASKKAADRLKDRVDLHLLELFLREYESRKP
jgi:hypothetical protein